MRIKKEINFKADLLRKAEGIMETFENYTDGVNLLMLIWRAKEGAQSANNDKLHKIITSNKEEFRSGLLKLLDEKDKSGLELRIYSSVNSRDVAKAIRNFKQEQLEADYYREDDFHRFYLDIKNRFVGALMKPGSRKGTKFLIDVDSEQAHQYSLKALAEIGIEILDVFKTKNGWHIITNPFNPALFTVENAEIKKDGMLLLDY